MGGNAAGYTGSSINLRNALTAEGVEFTEKARVVLHYCHPADCFPISGKTNLLWSMYEGEPLPPIFAAKFARVHAVIAPSQFVYDLFKPHVGKKPLVVSHIGFDDSLYTYKERSWEPGKGQFEFLWVGAPNPRKGWPATFSSWAHLFQDKEWAHLTMKTSSETGKGTLRHFGNATFDSRLYTREEMRDLYHQANAFVFPTAGEGFGLCVGFSTEIITSNGTVDICDIRSGDTVLSSDGKYHKVNKTVCKYGKTISIKITGQLPVEATECHPFYAVKRRAKRFNASANPSSVNIESLAGWIKASELSKGDFVAYPRYSINEPLIKSINIKDYLDNNKLYKECDSFIRCKSSPSSTAWFVDQYDKIGESRKIRRPKRTLVSKNIEVDDDLLYLFGWYIAEGSSNGGVGIAYTMCGDELRDAKYLCYLLNKKFNILPAIETAGGNCIKVKSYSRIVSRCFSQWFGSGAKDKKIPEFLMNSPRSMGPLLRGLFLGDGCMTKNQEWSLSSASRTLVYQVRLVLSAVGIHSSMSYNEPRNSSYLRIYTLRIAGQFIDSFCVFTKLQNPRVSKRTPANTAIVSNKYIFTAIRKIDSNTKEQIVYDLSVEKEHSFVGNGVLLHNTAAEALATGCPVVTTRYGGQMEFLDNGVAWTIDSVFENIPMTNGIGYLRSACADVPDLGRKMIEIIQDYPKALERAKRGSVRMHAKFTMRAAARQLLRNIQLLGYA